jgi:multicomponent Na+:H+ antiporter subunit B
MSLDLVLRIGTKLILPFILLFAFYIQFHGDYGPGGGFQAGVIAAGTVILVAITFGLETAHRVAPYWMVDLMVPLGMLIFAGTGVAGLVLGYNYLEYTGFARNPAHGHEYGILMVEFGVLVTVSGTIVALFYAFVERGR